MSILARVRRAPELTFVVVAFTWSWFWWSFALASLERIVVTPFGWLTFLFLGGPGPTIGAATVMFALDGWQGVKALLGKLLVWRAHVGWYLLAIVGPSVIILLGIPLATLVGAELGPVDWSRWPALVTAVAMAIPFGPLNEELGWRGFWQPRLAARHGLGAGSVLLGTVWLLWHVPLFWLPGGAAISGPSLSPLAVVWYLAYLVGWAALFGWLAERTRSNVWLAILLHASLNARAPLRLFPEARGPEQQLVVFFSLIPVAVMAAIAVGSSRTHRRNRASMSTVREAR